MDKRFTVFPALRTLEELVRQGSLKDASNLYFMVEDDGRIIGVLTREAALLRLKQGRKTDALADIAIKNLLTVTENVPILRLFSMIFSHEMSFVLVLSDGTTPTVANVRGLITKDLLAKFVAEAAEQFSP